MWFCCRNYTAVSLAFNASFPS